MNPMKEIRLEKVTLNIGAGEAGPLLEKAKTIIGKITGKKVVVTRTHKRTTFGGAKKRPIGVKTTVRGPEAMELAVRLLQAVENKVKASSFDRQGNLSFGIEEYINIPGIKYDPEVGILGMDVCLTFARPGYRIKNRMIRPKKVGRTHRITPDEAREWAQKTFKLTIE